MSEPSSILHTRPSLLLRIRDPADAAAWQTFVDIYGPLVYRHARRHGLQDADAADLTQEVLAQVARCISSFEYQPERGRFRNWLGTVTRRRLGRFVAKLSGSPASSDALDQVESPQADSEWIADFNARVLEAALERIRPHFAPATWRIFELVWLGNRSAIATADELGVPIDSVYLAKSRVLKRLEEEVLLLAEDLLPVGP